MIDLAWKQSIRPILLRHYPHLTEAQLREAHAYAYGGCVIQDLGYYPFGNVFFSDLTHYVRAGDFVSSLLRNAHNANELAFAIGALSHYVGDTIGHARAVNQSVAVEFPGLEKKYGPVVNYAEGEHQHVRTEFAFDINQMSKHRLAPAAYLEHVGLEVSAKLIQKAVWETYGLDSRKMLGDKQTVLRSYRKSVRSLIPEVAHAEIVLHQKSFPADIPSDSFDELRNELIQAATDNDWEQYRKTPGFKTHVFAGVIFILPKVGPLSMLAIRGPQTQTEAMYIESLDESMTALRHLLTSYSTIPTNIPNRDLDTGAKVRPGGYRLTDETYAKLLATLTRPPAQPIPFSLKRDILDYYSDPSAPITTKKNERKWAAVESQLKVLAAMPTTEDPSQVLSDMDETAPAQQGTPSGGS